MTLTNIIGLLVPIATLYVQFQILRSVKTMAEETKSKKELADTVKKFAQMFAEAAEVPKPPKKLKTEEA